MTIFEIGAIILFLGIIILMIFEWCRCTINESKNEEDIRNRVRENRITLDNLKSYMTFNEYDGCLLLNKDNKLFNVRPSNNNMIITEIKFEDILDVKVDIHTKERNSMKVMSIVPTFDKCELIQKINMTITTEDEIYDLNITKDAKQYQMHRMYANNEIHKSSWNKKINELNRLKLLIEKNMKLSKEEM